MSRLPKNPTKIRERLKRYERELRQEFKNFGFFDDSSGKRYLLGPLYLMLGDTKGALKSFEWFEKTFPDDSGEPEHSQLAAKAVRFVLNGQRSDGSWLYGPGEIHGWVDNFHTAFILDSLRRIIAAGVAEPNVSSAIASGLDYWIKNFFLEDGTPRYFDQQTYPIDIHSAAAAISTLSGFAKSDERALPLARKIAEWTIANLIGPDGNTYYQKRRFYTIRTPFIRWGQAWMAYALALLIEAETTK